MRLACERPADPDEADYSWRTSFRRRCRGHPYLFSGPLAETPHHKHRLINERFSATSESIGTGRVVICARITSNTWSDAAAFASDPESVAETPADLRR